MDEFPLSKRTLKGTSIQCVNDAALGRDSNTSWGKNEQLGNGIWKFVLKKNELPFCKLIQLRTSPLLPKFLLSVGGRNVIGYIENQRITEEQHENEMALKWNPGWSI